MAADAENAHYQPKSQNEEPAPAAPVAPEEPGAAGKARATQPGAKPPGTP